MKGIYIVAQNAFSVSAPDALRAWRDIESRFAPFLADRVQPTALDVKINRGELPEYDAELIYDTEYNGVGFITARASRLNDGSFVMEFTHIRESEPRLLMKMPAEFDRADIVIDPKDDSSDSYFLTHALMIAFMLAMCGNGTMMIHASSVVQGGKAYLFQGKSGTGKSTHASLWVSNIAGTELLNDDNPLIRFSTDGTAVAYGSPWSGKTHCYRNIAAPIGAFVRIVRDSENALQKLAPLKAYASLTSSIYYIPFLNETQRNMRHKTIERLVGSVACCEMHCRPDNEAAIICWQGLSDISNK